MTGKPKTAPAADNTGRKQETRASARTKKATEPKAPKREPTQREKAAIEEARVRTAARRKRIEVAGEPDAPEKVSNPHNDGKGFQSAILDTFGTTSLDFVDRCSNHLSGAMNKATYGSIRSLNAGLAAVAGIRPENEAEAMLAVQMVATHEAAMSMLGQLRAAQFIDPLSATGGLAVKLLRTYTAQMEALHKIRRGGEQTVRVEHVNVYPGAQAIVGSVSQGGGGGSFENGNQPHEARDARALGFAPSSSVWSAEPIREPVPASSGEGSDEMPLARRC